MDRTEQALAAMLRDVCTRCDQYTGATVPASILTAVTATVRRLVDVVEGWQHPPAEHVDVLTAGGAIVRTIVPPPGCPGGIDCTCGLAVRRAEVIAALTGMFPPLSEVTSRD